MFRKKPQTYDVRVTGCGGDKQHEIGWWHKTDVITFYHHPNWNFGAWKDELLLYQLADTPPPTCLLVAEDLASGRVSVGPLANDCNVGKGREPRRSYRVDRKRLRIHVTIRPSYLYQDDFYNLAAKYNDFVANLKDRPLFIEHKDIQW
jgi:hypothetical protein